VVSVDISTDLAAVFYAATLTRDPTLDANPDSEALAAYHATGQRLASTLLSPTETAVIRCTCGTRDINSSRTARGIATVHDRDLLVVRESRAYATHGVRLVNHLLVDFSIARRDGFDSTAVYCYRCGALHQLGFRWLHTARRNKTSTPSEQYKIAEWGAPIAPQGYTPRHPNDVNRLAFARTTGTLDGSPLLVALGWLYAFEYRDHFGFKPPHEDHLLRLTGGLDRYEEPWLWEMLTPQWRRYQLYPEERELDGWNQPIRRRELRGLARAIASEEPDERQDSILLFQEVLTPRRFGTLQRLIQKETR
jgi:hypothetical protein